jgi:hypothetical protein
VIKVPAKYVSTLYVFAPAQDHYGGALANNYSHL